MKPAVVLAAAVTALEAMGCASTSPQPAFRAVAAAVEQRSGHRIEWDQGTADDTRVAHAIDQMLARELTVEGAVQIALLRNQSLQAMYEGLGVAQADLVQAGLLSNPVFGVSLAPSEYDTLQPPVVFNVVMDFLDVITLPARKKIAATELEAVEMRVGDAALELAANVRTAYFGVQGAQQVVAMRRTIVEAADASAELARRQHDAGNLSDLDLASQEALDEQARLDLTRAEGDVLAARERLTRLMGVWGAQTQWRVSDRLPELPPGEGSLDHLEKLAIAQRLDLASRRRQVEVLSRTLSYVESTRWTPSVQAQLEVAPFIASGHDAIGPGGSIALPIFDQGQARVAGVRALLRQSQRRLDALAVEVRSQVRAARDRVLLARQVVERYRATLVPLRERIVALSQQQYNAMLLGVYQLIQAKESDPNPAARFLRQAAYSAAGRRSGCRATAGTPGRVHGRVVGPATPRRQGASKAWGRRVQTRRPRPAWSHQVDARWSARYPQRAAGSRARRRRRARTN